MSQIDKKILKEPNANTLYVLDIDSTLVTTHQRNQAILEAFVETHSSSFPEDCKKIQRLDCQHGDYGFHSTMKRQKLEEKDLHCFPELQKFWRQHFFSNTYLKHDTPTEGAVEWTKLLYKKQIPFIYLTARHKVSMWDGTLESMNQMGFPIHEDQLFLKEDLNMTDEEYKTKFIHKLIQQNPDKKLLLIDNEPVVLNKIAQNLPSVGLVWFELTHSGKMEAPQQALTIQNFIF